MNIALYPGSFSPPHIGHFDVVQKLCSEMDKVYIIKSDKERDGISAEQSVNVWNLYLQLLPDNVEIRLSKDKSPITECFHIIKNDYDNDYYIVFGKNELDRVRSFEKLNSKNVHIYNAGNYGNISATNFRQALRDRNIEQIKTFLPPGINVTEFMEKMGLNLHEIKIVPKYSNIPPILDLGEEHEWEDTKYMGSFYGVLSPNKKYIIDYYGGEDEEPSIVLRPIENKKDLGRTDWYLSSPDERRYIDTKGLPVIYEKDGKLIREIKILPNIITIDPQEGDIYEGKDKDGHRVTIIIQRFKRPGQVRDYEVIFTLSKWDEEYGHNKTKTINSSVEGLIQFIKTYKLKLVKKVDEIKIVPNQRQPQVGDIWDVKPYGLVKIINTKYDDSYRLLCQSNNIDYYEYKKDFKGKFVSENSEVIESLFTKNWWNKHLIQESQEQVVKLTEEQKSTIKQFIGFAFKELKITTPLNGLTISYDNNAVKERASFAYYDPNTNKIWVYVKNRNMADILRSIAHELVHSRQNEEGRLKQDSGNTGSEIENEANSKAGVMLRNFGKDNKGIYEIKIVPNTDPLSELKKAAKVFIDEIKNLMIQPKANYEYVGMVLNLDWFKAYRLKEDGTLGEYSLMNSKIQEALWQIGQLFISSGLNKGNSVFFISKTGQLIFGQKANNLYHKKSLDEIKIQPNIRLKVGNKFVYENNTKYIAEITKIDYKTNKLSWILLMIGGGLPDGKMDEKEIDINEFIKLMDKMKFKKYE